MQGTPEGFVMIGIAISLLQLLIGVIVICAVIYFVFYVLRQVMGIAIPARLEQMVWLIVLILVLIALLSMIAGGDVASGFHFWGRH
jgi:uncharacterized membrane protein YoaK (UPF0700 family)